MSLHPDIKVGSVFTDNDPRCAGRTIEVIELYPNGVLAKASTGKIGTHLAKFLHCDGKPRKSGFSLIRDEKAKP